MMSVFKYLSRWVLCVVFLLHTTNMKLLFPSQLKKKEQNEFSSSTLKYKMPF